MNYFQRRKGEREGRIVSPTTICAFDQATGLRSLLGGKERKKKKRRRSKDIEAWSTTAMPVAQTNKKKREGTRVAFVRRGGKGKEGGEEEGEP